MKLRKIFLFLAVLTLTLGICTACGDLMQPAYYTVQAQYDETLGSVTVSKPASENGYVAGEQVTVTVVPNSGVEVKKVTLNGEDKELVESKLTFAVSKNTTVAVTFEETAAQPQVVTLTLPTDGTVTASPAAPYHEGDTVTLTITAPNGQQLKSIKVNGTEKVTEVSENTLQIVLSADTTVTVEYENIPTPPQVVTLTLPADNTVTASPAAPYHEGDTVTLTITAPSGQQLKSIKVNGTEKFSEVTENTLQIQLTADTTVTVEYENIPTPPQVVTLTLPADNTVTASPAAPYHEGDTVILTITAPNGQQLKSIKVNDVEKISEVDDNTLEIQLSGNTTVTVEYENIPTPPQEVTLSLPADGTVTAAPTGTYHEGDTVTLTITAPSGQKLKSIKVNNVEKISEVEDNTLQIQLTTDTTVTVEYEADTPEVIEIGTDWQGYYEGHQTVNSQTVNFALRIGETKVELKIGDEIFATGTVTEYKDGDHISFTLPGKGTWKIEAPWGTQRPYQSVMLSGGSDNLKSTTCTRAEDPGLGVDDELIGVWTATDHTLSITKQAIDLDGKQATTYHKDTILTFTTYSFTVEGVVYSGELEGDTFTLSGGSGDPIVFTRQGGQITPPELTIPDNLVGVWTTTAGDHTMTVTKTALTLDGASATAFETLQEASTVYYNFTAGGKDYTMMFGADNTLSVSEKENTGNSIQFTVKDGEPIAPPEVEILEEYKGEFEGEKSGTKYHVSVTDEGIFVTIGDAQPVQATLTGYTDGRGYTFTLGDDETVYRLQNYADSYDKMNFFYGSWATECVLLDRITETEVIEIDADWQGYFEGTQGGVKYALRISATQVELKIGDGEFSVGTVTECVKGDHISFTLSGGTWKIEAPWSGSPYQSVMLSGGPDSLKSTNCLRTENN